MNVEEYMAHDATALAELVARRDVTATQLLALARQRAAEVNPRLNAIVADLGDVADARADSALTGPLAGVPFVIKDLLQEYAGFPTSYGSRSLAKDVALEHAPITQRFLDAGLVIFGKTNTSEFGTKAVTEPELWGAARNPWHTGRTPGGSSGGSGAAVAAGIVPVAGANDGGGSIRVPAACNGLVGLKPTRGLVPTGPRGGDQILGLATQGVVSRTVRDSATCFDAIIGADPGTAYTVGAPGRRFVDVVGTDPAPLRIGYSTFSPINPAPAAEAGHAVTDAAQLLTDLGHHVEEVRPPCADGGFHEDFLAIWFAEVLREVRESKRRTGADDSGFEADTLAAAEVARAAGVYPVMRAVDNTIDYCRTLSEFHSHYDYLLTPTLATEPLPVGKTTTAPLLQRASRLVYSLRAGKLLTLSGVIDSIIEENLGWVPYTQLANVTGRPAISVPLHWTATGLPLGVQFVGKPGSDGDLLQLAGQLERARPWVQRFPAPAAARP